jgi:hypothetical protein
VSRIVKLSGYFYLESRQAFLSLSQIYTVLSVHRSSSICASCIGRIGWTAEEYHKNLAGLHKYCCGHCGESYDTVPTLCHGRYSSRFLKHRLNVVLGHLTHKPEA